MIRDDDIRQALKRDDRDHARELAMLKALREAGIEICMTLRHFLATHPEAQRPLS